MTLVGKIGRAVHGFLCSVGGLMLVAGVLCAGFFERPPLVLLPIGAVWCLAKVLRSWTMWSEVSRASKSRTFHQMMGSALLLQLVYVAMLYGAGVGLSELYGGERGGETLELVDWLLVGALAIVALPLRAFGGSALEFAADSVSEIG